MNIYWGMSREKVEAAFKEGKKIAYKHCMEGDSGWCEDEDPEFNWDEWDYTVIVGDENYPYIDMHTDNGPFLGKGEVRMMPDDDINLHESFDDPESLLNSRKWLH